MKRYFSLLLCILMVFSMFPAEAFAEEKSTETSGEMVAEETTEANPNEVQTEDFSAWQEENAPSLQEDSNGETSEEEQLQSALGDAACSSFTLTGDLTLSADISISHDFTIDGGGKLIIPDGVHVYAGTDCSVTFAMEELVIQSGGGFTITDCRIYSNTKISMDDGATLTLVDSADLFVEEDSWFISKGVVTLTSGDIWVRGTFENQGRMNIGDNGSVFCQSTGVFDTSAGSYTCTGPWFGATRVVSTEQEFIDAVQYIYNLPAGSYSICLSADITVNRENLPKEWEGSLPLYGSFSIYTEGWNRDSIRTLSLNCDMKTGAANNGNWCILGFHVDCCNLNLGGVWQTETEDNVLISVYNGSTLAVLSGGEMQCSSDLSISYDSKLNICSGAVLTVSDIGEIDCEGTLENNGSIQNNGAITIETGATATGNGSLSGNPYSYPQTREVSTEEEFLQAVAEMNDGGPGTRTLILQNDITISDDESDLVFKGDYVLQTAEEVNAKLILQRGTISGGILDSNTAAEEHGSMTVYLDLVLEAPFTSRYRLNVGVWGTTGGITVRQGASLTAEDEMSIRSGGTVSVLSEARITIESFTSLSGTLTVDGTLEILAGRIYVQECGTLTITGSIAGPEYYTAINYIDGATVSIPQEYDYLLGTDRYFATIQELKEYVNGEVRGTCYAQYTGQETLTEDLILPDNVELRLGGYYNDGTTLVIAKNIKLQVNTMYIHGSLVLEEGAELIVEQLYIFEDASLTNSGSVRIEEDGYFNLMGRVVNHGSFVNNANATIGGEVENDGTWEMNGYVSREITVSTEQELIDAISSGNRTESDVNICLTQSVTLTQEMVVPGYVYIYTDAENVTLTIGDGVDLTLSSFDDGDDIINGNLSLSGISLIITEGGSLEFDEENFSGLDVYGANLTIFGTLAYAGTDHKIYVSEETIVTGLDRSEYIIYRGVTNEKDLRNVIEKHANDGGPTEIYLYSVAGTVTLSSDLQIPSGETLTVFHGATIIIPEGVSLSLCDGATLCLYGTITANGTLDCEHGSFVNQGTVNGEGAVSEDNSGLEEELRNALQNGTDWHRNSKQALELTQDLTLNGSCTLSGASTLIIPDGITFTIPEGSILYLFGITIQVKDGGKLVNHGEIYIDGGGIQFEDGSIYEDSEATLTSVVWKSGSISGIELFDFAGTVVYMYGCSSAADLSDFMSVSLSPCKKTASVSEEITLEDSITIDAEDTICLTTWYNGDQAITSGKLIIPEGCSLVIYGSLDIQDEAEIVVECGGSLIFAEDSCCYRNGTITIESGGSLSDYGCHMYCTASVSSAEELTDKLEELRPYADELDAIALCLTSDIVITDLYLSGLNNLYLYAAWVDDGNVSGHYATLTVTGGCWVSETVTFDLQTVFSESSEVYNYGTIVAGGAVVFNGSYSGHLDENEQGYLIQPWYQGDDLSTDLNISGNDILRHVTLQMILVEQENQTMLEALESAVESYAPAKSGVMELQIHCENDFAVTRDVTLPVGVCIIVPDSIHFTVKDKSTLTIDDGASLNCYDGSCLAVEQNSSLIVDGGVLNVQDSFVNHGEIYVKDTEATTVTGDYSGNPVAVREASLIDNGSINVPEGNYYILSFEVTYVWNSDNTQCTAYRRCTQNINYSETAISETVEHETEEPGCEEDGWTTYYAHFEEDWADAQEITTTIPATGHEWAFVRLDTDSVPYQNVYQCSHCEEEYWEEVDTPKATAVSLDCGSVLEISLNEGAEVTIVPTVLPQNANQSVTWSGLNNKYATFEADEETGALTIKDYLGATGSITLTCTAKGTKVKSTVKLTFVRYAESLNILDSKGNDITNEVSLNGKTSTTFKALLQAENGTVSDKAICWSLDSEDYATVNETTGKVTVKSFAGDDQLVTLTASASDGEVSDSIQLRLVANLQQSIEIHDIDGNVLNDVSLAADISSESLELLYVLENLEGTVKWTSSSTKVAEISAVITQTGEQTEKAVITLKNTGTSTITASCGKIKASFKLTVVRYVDTIEIDGPQRLVSGKSATYKAVLNPTNPSNKNIEWKLADGDEAYATLSKGKLTARSGLTSQVNVTLTAVSADDRGACISREITLIPAVSSIEIAGAPDGKADVQETIRLVAGVEPLAATQNVTWTSSSKSYSIDETGMITPAANAKAATVTFTATANDGSGKKASVKISFIRLMTYDDMSLPETAALGAGKSISFKATITSLVTNKNISWSMEPVGTMSPDELAAYVTLSGSKLTAKNTVSELTEPLTVKITGTAQDGSGVSKSCLVTLYPVAKSVTIHGALSGKADVQKKIHLTADIAPVTACQDVAWTSNNKNFVIDDKGNITALDSAKAATVTFTATAKDGSGKKASVKISFIRLMTEEDLKLQQAAILGVGKSLTLKPEITSTVTNQKLIWTLDDTTYASMSGSTITAKKSLAERDEPVVVTATATTQDGTNISRSCEITLYPALVKSVNICQEGELKNGKTLEFNGSMVLVLENASADAEKQAAQAWTVKSSNKNIQAEIVENDQHQYELHLTALEELKAKTSVTITVTAADGSGKSAKVVLKVPAA